MIIRATDTELNISGSPTELQQVAAALTNLTSGQRCRYTADLTADPVPYERLLAAFEAIASFGPIRVSVASGTVLATGSADMLRVFASVFEFTNADRSGTHHHHEWWEGNEYIAADSRPLVVSVA